MKRRTTAALVIAGTLALPASASAGAIENAMRAETLRAVKARGIPAKLSEIDRPVCMKTGIGRYSCDIGAFVFRMAKPVRNSRAWECNGIGRVDVVGRLANANVRRLSCKRIV